MRRFLIAVALVVAGFIGSATPAKAAAITFSSTTANVGQTFTVDVWFTGFNPGIFAYSFDFVFNNTVLRLDEISRGTLFGNSGLFWGQEGKVSGEVDALSWPSFDTPRTLATLTFTALAAGSGALQFTELGFLSLLPFDINVTNGNGVTVAGGGTLPTPVPEPGTMTLFGIGAYALARRLRRRSTDAAA